MKKIYITPSVELIELKKVDIITASSPLDNTDWTNGDYDDTSFMDYNTIINGLNDGKHFKFH